jgi:drug/metabolite transporter (DMT)-like permease
MSGRLYTDGTVYAAIAAALFGASTPLAKLLIGDIDPVLLAALLYLGSGAGIFLLLRIRRISEPAAREVRLEPRDYPWLVGAVLARGVIAPISLFFGLLLVRERHIHRHLHERMVHMHRHRHDEHHAHLHAGEDIDEHVH